MILPGPANTTGFAVVPVLIAASQVGRERERVLNIDLIVRNGYAGDLDVIEDGPVILRDDVKAEYVTKIAL